MWSLQPNDQVMKSSWNLNAWDHCISTMTIIISIFIDTGNSGTNCRQTSSIYNAFDYSNLVICSLKHHESGWALEGENTGVWAPGFLPIHLRVYYCKTNFQPVLWNPQILPNYSLKTTVGTLINLQYISEKTKKNQDCPPFMWSAILPTCWWTPAPPTQGRPNQLLKWRDQKVP